MRLIHLSGYDGAHGGSFIPMLRSVLGAARRRGWRAETAFTETGRGRSWLGELKADGLRARFCPSGSLSGRARWIADVLSESTEPTVLHTHFTAFDVPAVLAARGRAPTAVFWHLHTPPAPSLRVATRNVAKFAIVARRVEEVMCVAPHMAERIGRWAPRGKVSFVANGIDVDGFRPADAHARRLAREELALPQDTTLLVHFGWDWRVKGGDLFLETVRLLRAGGVSVSAITRTESPEAADLRDRLDLGETVRVIRFVPRIQTLYAAADLLVSSSRAEGMPFAVAEALASGVPVVASDIPGHAALGADLGACRLTELDPTALAAGARALLGRDPDVARADAAQARSRIAERMGLVPWGERLVDTYERVLGPAPTEGGLRMMQT